LLNIPKDSRELASFSREIIDTCFNSYPNRSSQYRLLRNVYLTGTQNGNLATFNRIHSHIEYLVSFLFSGETVVFELDHEGKEARHDLMAKEMSRRLKDRWHDNKTDIMLYDACVWSLVYDSMFIKVDRRHDYLIDPFDIGVYREDLTSFDDQEAIVQRVYVTTDDFRRTLLHLVDNGKMSNEEALSALTRVKTYSIADDMDNIPPSMSNLIISATQPMMKGSVQTPEIIKGTDIAKPYVDATKIIRGYELWVWNDEAVESSDGKSGKKDGDWHIITVFDPDIVVYSRPNYYSPAEHPFVQICPNRVYNYFFGMSEIAKLINIHELTEKRIKQISQMQDRQFKPPVRVYGMGMMNKDQQDAMYAPGGVVSFPNPQAKMEQDKVDVGESVWKELEVYEKMFTEISGIPPGLRGYGEKGVRSAAHMQRLASLASSRIKKAALIVEDAIERVAFLRMKMVQKYDNRTMSYLEGDKRIHFTAEQFNEPYSVKVSAHSSSPTFVENIKQEALQLLQLGIIDGEMLTEVWQFPYQNRIRERLKNMAMAAEKEKAEGKQLAMAELTAKAEKTKK
jgi:hypothetical protein